MWGDVFNIAISNGVFAALFVSLLIYTLKDSRKREGNYQKIISSLSSKLSTVDEIKQDVSDIKQCLNKVSLTKRRDNEKTNKKL